MERRGNRPSPVLTGGKAGESLERAVDLSRNAPLDGCLCNLLVGAQGSAAFGCPISPRV